MTPQSEDMDLRGRVVNIEHRVSEMASRVLSIETWRSSKEVSDARSDEQMKALTDDVKSIKSGISRLFWTIIAAIVAVIVAFAMNGGFAKAQDMASAILETPHPIPAYISPMECPYSKPIRVAAYCRAR